MLFWVQTGNLMSGMTTCERYGGLQKKLIVPPTDLESLNQTFDSSKPKPRMSVLSLDDSQDYNNLICCSGPIKMCCNTKITS